MNPKLFSLISPVDPRTIALVVVGLVAFFMGLRFEQVNTQKVKLAWRTEQLQVAQALTAAVKDAVKTSEAARDAAEKANVISSKREAQRNVEHSNLLARYNAERVRSEALRKSAADSPATNTGVGEPGAARGIFNDEIGADIISLVSEADLYLNGLRDAQAYIGIIKDACAPQQPSAGAR